MIAALYTILRYGHGEIGLTGWGTFWLVTGAAFAAGHSTTNVIRDRANRRADRATQSGEQTGASDA